MGGKTALPIALVILPIERPESRLASLMRRQLLQLSIFLSALFCAISSAQDLGPESAIVFLFGRGDEMVTDAQGFSYKIFYVRERSPLQQLIDGVTTRLLQTETGNQICTVIFKRQPALLANHLGMSPAAATQAASQCPVNVSETGPVWTDGKESGFSKSLSLSPQRSLRTYKIVVTNRGDLPFDSWTDAFTNNTTIFIHHSEKRSDISLRHLTQVVAHELAIYTDAKTWPLGPDWEKLLELQGVRFNGPRVKAAMVAALNPTIGAVLASVRAFKIERLMVRELMGRGFLGQEKVVYPVNEYPFLRLNCDKVCLYRYVMDQQKWIEPMYVHLLALAPHFRIRRLGLLSEERGVNYEGEDVVLDIMERKPVALLTSLSAQDSWRSLEYITGNSNLGSDGERAAGLKVIRELLKEDLDLLSTTQVQRTGSDHLNVDLLTFLSIPLLSDMNIAIAAGPRPRIRSGGTR